jgi:hypothetical protein
VPLLYVLIHASVAAALSWLAYGAARRSLEREEGSSSGAWVGLALAAAVGMALLLRRYPERLANLLPHRDAFFFSDPTPHLALALAAFAIGAAGSRVEAIRRALLSLTLVGLALYASDVSVFVRTWPAREAGLDVHHPCYPVVRQSAPSTCAAAAAATLLRHLGLDPDASEGELVEACGTSPSRGTSPLGLWRGLSLHGTARYVWPSVGGLNQVVPCILRVGLQEGVDPELYRVLRDECGWTKDESHAVVFYGFAPGRPGEESTVALIGDPRFGFERWGITHFRALWHGVALNLR